MPLGPLGWLEAKTLPFCLPGVLGEGLQRIRGYRAHMPPALESLNGAEISLLGLAGSEKGFT